MPSRLLAHFSKSTDVWVCNYTLNAGFFFLCVCVSLHKHFRPRLKAAALQRRLSTHSDATDDNSAIRLISGLYRPALVTNVTPGHNINLRDFEWLQSAVQSG